MKDISAMMICMAKELIDTAMEIFSKGSLSLGKEKALGSSMVQMGEFR